MIAKSHARRRHGTSTRKSTSASRKAAGSKSVKKARPRKRATKARAKTSSARRSRTTSRRWSQRVTQGSDALDLTRGVFTLHDPKKIASSLKRSAKHSKRRKSGAYRSAVSMLTFYINRAGKTLPAMQRRRLERAKGELKRLFHRDT